MVRVKMNRSNELLEEETARIDGAIEAFGRVVSREEKDWGELLVVEVPSTEAAEQMLDHAYFGGDRANRVPGFRLENHILPFA